jgi:hypothetical protein
MKKLLPDWTRAVNPYDSRVVVGLLGVIVTVSAVDLVLASPAASIAVAVNEFVPLDSDAAV